MMDCSILKPNFVAMNHLVADGRERLADEFLVREWPVDFGRVEEGDAAVDRWLSPMHPSPIAETSSSIPEPGAALGTLAPLHRGRQGACDEGAVRRPVTRRGAGAAIIASLLMLPPVRGLCPAPRPA